MGYSLAAAA